jgi:hypothetical protein
LQIEETGSDEVVRYYRDITFGAAGMQRLQRGGAFMSKASLESYFRKNKVTPWLKAQGIWAANQSAKYASRRGIPDILCVTLKAGIELKKKKKFPRDETYSFQKDELRRINKEGGFGWVAYPENWELTKKLLLRIKDKGGIRK